ncbi:MAG: 3-hydroxyacyl-CoA dehydrogenase family protein [Candidatus Thorarchaeota archaeon]
MRKLHKTNIAIIGSGIMGTGIAQVALLSGYQKVSLNDVNEKFLKKARDLIEYRIQSLTNEEKFNDFISNDPIMQNLMKTTTFEEFKSSFKSVGILSEGFTSDDIMDHLVCEKNLKKTVSNSDFVIEAVPENLDLKCDIFKQISAHSPSHAIIASNTSTMSPTKLGSSTDRPDKVIGMHFHGSFPIRGRLIEVTGGERTSEETLDIGCQIAGQFPSIAGDRFILRLEKETPGFVANRLTLARAIHLNWILDNAVKQGISTDQLIAGGLRLIGLDIVGLDTIYNTWKYLEENLHPDFAPGKVVTDLVQMGNLGKKTGKGFLEWRQDQPLIKNVNLDDRTKEFLTVNRDKNLAMAIRMNEACRLIEEGVIKGHKIISKIDTIEGRQQTFLVGIKKFKEWTEILEHFAKKLRKLYLKPCNMMKSGKFKEFP